MSAPDFCFTATCRTPDGGEVLHTIVLRADGTVSTEDHDNEKWAEDALTIQYLNPDEPSPHACDWWAGRTRALTWWESGLIGGVIDPADWSVPETDGPLTTHAYATFCSRNLIESRTLPGQPQPSVSRMHETLKMLCHQQKQHLDSDILGDAVYDSHLEKVATVPLEDFQYLLESGIHVWRHIVPLLAIGLGREKAADLYLAATREDPDIQHWYGGLPDSIDLALQNGVPKERLAAFFSRRSGNGPLVFDHHLFSELLKLQPQAPHVWLIEAVGTIPSGLACESHYGADVATEISPHDRALTLVHAAALQKASELLESQGDPAGWDRGWEYPSEYELAKMRRRGSRKTFRLERP